MQTRSAQALPAELHGSSGAKERRHQDDRAFHNLMREALTERFGAKAIRELP